MHGKKFAGQEGFFQASVYSTFDVEECALSSLPSRLVNIDNTCSAVIVDWQSGENGGNAGLRELSFLKKINVPVALFCGNAKAGLLPDDNVLDLFSVVFKREPYKDLDRYPISYANKSKIQPTMLACKAIPLNSRDTSILDVSAFGHDTYGPEFESDVFFLGQATHRERIDTLRTVKSTGLRLGGGIYPLSKRTQMQQKETIPLDAYTDVYHEKIKSDVYFNKMCKSKINLILNGFGEFTFRHQEAWLFNCFSICESVIEDLNLLIRVKPYEHYVPYLGLDDLKHKIRQYISDANERGRIAANARRQFLEDYSVKDHGEQIKQILENL